MKYLFETQDAGMAAHLQGAIAAYGGAPANTNVAPAAPAAAPAPAPAPAAPAAPPMAVAPPAAGGVPSPMPPGYTPPPAAAAAAPAAPPAAPAAPAAPPPAAPSAPVDLAALRASAPEGWDYDKHIGATASVFLKSKGCGPRGLKALCDELGIPSMRECPGNRFPDAYNAMIARIEKGKVAA